MTSSESNPASAKRARMASVESNGAGIVPSGAGAVALGRLRRNCNRGAPGQLLMPTALASWILGRMSQSCMHGHPVVDETHKSPGEMAPSNCERNCAWALTMSSIPPLAGYCVSTSSKIIMEPSAPPPLNSDYELLLGKEDMDARTQRDLRITKTRWHHGN